MSSSQPCCAPRSTRAPTRIPTSSVRKFIVRDVDERTRALLTGSTNFTRTGVDSKPGRMNPNHIVIPRDTCIGRECRAEFEEIWQGTFGEVRNRHDPKPLNHRIAGICVRPLVAPNHAPEMEIMKQTLKAKHRVDFAIFTFSQSSGIDDAMVAMATGNEVKIRGAFDGGQDNQQWAATRMVADSGGEAWLVPQGGGVSKLHHKLVVIDGEVIICDSFNYTDPANRLNDENILVIGDLEKTRTKARADQKKLAGFALKEIDRMIADHGVRVPLSA